MMLRLLPVPVGLSKMPTLPLVSASYTAVISWSWTAYGAKGNLKASAPPCEIIVEASKSFRP